MMLYCGKEIFSLIPTFFHKFAAGKQRCYEQEYNSGHNVSRLSHTPDIVAHRQQMGLAGILFDCRIGQGKSSFQGIAAGNTRCVAENAYFHTQDFGRGRLCHTHGISRSSSACGICTDTEGTFASSPYQCLGCLGFRERSGHNG